MALLTKTGLLAYLRVNEQGHAYGGHDDRITAEVVVRLEDDDGAYGFRLLDDDDLPVRQAYVDLLRDAMNHHHEVHLDVDQPEGKKTGIIIRVWLTPTPTSGSLQSPWWTVRRPTVARGAEH